MAPNSPRTRIPAALAMLGGALWAASWSFNSVTEDGTRAVLGLSERGWRRLLDPALACLIVALAAYRRRYAWPGSRAAVFGWSTATLGLVAMLVGNVIEFWIGELLYVNVPGQFKPSDHVGWALFLAGLMILSGGFVVLGVVHFRSRLVPGWRRGLPLLMGLLPPLVLLLATVAQAAAATLIFILVFALGWVMLGIDLWSSARRAAYPRMDPTRR